MQDIVWTGNEAEAIIYEDDGAGNTVGDPLITYCFLQNVSVRGTVQLDRREVTGRPRRKLVPHAWEYEVSIEHLYLRKSKELKLDTVFNREKKLQIVFALEHLYEAPELADVHRLKVAFGGGFTLNSVDNQNVTGSAQFSAEQFE